MATTTMNEGQLLDVPKLLPDIRKNLSGPALDFYERHWDDGDHRFDAPIVFFDVETTGLDPNTDDIIEIGALSVAYDGVDVGVDAFWTLIAPGRPLPPKIVEITKLTDYELARHGANPQNAYTSFLDWVNRVSPKRFVAHNSRFDEGMIRGNLSRRGLDDTAIPEFICTMSMSKRLLPKLENNKLTKVAEHYRISNTKAHRAICDAETTALCFFNMMKEKN